MDKTRYWTVCFASLLYGIDEFFNLDAENPSDKSLYIHDLLDEYNGAKLCGFLELEVLKDILHYYADPENNTLTSEAEPYVRIIDTASRLSKKDSNADIGSKVKHEYVHSIFSRLDLGNGFPKPLVYRYVPLEPDAVFPCDPDTVDMNNDDVRKLQVGLRTYWKKALSEAKTVGTLYQMLMRILERYTWCIPMAGQSEIADISLYDHLRLTSAIAACLYKKKEEDPQFDDKLMQDDTHESLILAAGDFSGIQKYIFSGTSEKQGGMAKKLRARSFAIASLINLATRVLIDRCDLPSSCVLMNSGGNFFILLPNTETVKNKLGEFQQEIDRELFDTFQGNVALHLAYVSMCGNDFGSFGDKIREVKEKLAVRKRQPYATFLQENGKWRDIRPFDDDVYARKLGICRSCGSEFAVEDSENGPVGRRCKQEIEIGRRLVQTDVVTLVRAKKGLLSLGGWSVLPYEAEGEIYALKSDDVSKLPAPLWRQANYVPARRDGALTFEEIANKSEGANWLGYLKADVDRLGMIFTVGFRRETGENYGNIARIASLSHMMDVFFSEWLNRLVEREFSDCYIVFSGGDDLFIIGPWHQVISLAIEVRKKFSEFTGNNPNITLSCGITFSPPKLPVAYAVFSAEQALDRAKEEHSSFEKSGRDQVCIFEHVMKWVYVGPVMTAAKKVAEWMDGDKLTAGDVRRLKIYAGMFEEYEASDCQDTRGLRYVGHLSYDIGRKMNESGKGLDNGVRKFLESLRDISYNGLINHLSVVCDYALLMNRKKEDLADE